MEESKKTYHEPEKKKTVMKIGRAGGGTGAVVLLGVATLAAAAAIASAIIVRIKGRKSGRNHRSHQEVEQSLQTEFPETLNKENDQDNPSKEREFILHNTPLSVKNNSCNGTADMDVIKDDSASFLFSENLNVDEKSMLEINGGTGTGDSAHDEEEVCCSDNNNNTKRLESSANTDASIVVVNKEELHLPTFDDKFLLEPDSKDETQNREVEIELNTDDDDAIEGVYIDKIVTENNQEAQENIEWKKNAAEMQFSEEDETKDRLDQETVQDYEQEISCNDDEQKCEDYVKDVLTFSCPAELSGKLNNENDQDNASKEIQFVRPHPRPSENKNPRTGAAGVDEIKADYVIKEDFDLPTFDDQLLHEPESKNKMHKHEVEIELAKEDGAIDAVELQFSEEKTKNFRDQEIVGTGNSMPGTTVLENHREGSLPIETVQKSERNEANDMAQVDEETKLVEQEECDYPDAEIRDCERKISHDDDEQNAESNAECAEEYLQELSVDGKGNSMMMELTETHNNQPRYASRRRILIGILSALSWFSCTWFFGLSFVKLGFIVLLTMILSKIHGY